MTEQESNSTLSFLQKDLSLRKGLSDKDKLQFYSEFGSMLDAGVDLRRALDIIIDEQTSVKSKELFSKLKEDILIGLSLSESMVKIGGFTPYEYHSIRIGEEAGRLKLVLGYLSNYFEDKVKLRRQLISVFTYPIFVMAITIGILYFMLNSVVPMFEDVFKQFGQDLPWLTQKIIFLSENFTFYLSVFFGVLLVFVLIGYSQRKEVWFRRFSSNLIIRIPVFGALIKKIYITRFCQSMSLLISAKTPLITAIALVEEMISFYPIEEALKSSRNDIKKGNSLHSGLSKFTIFDKRLISLVTIAEEINQLDVTFERLTKQYNEDIEHRTKVLGTVIQPAIILIIGFLVGVIMVAMYLPMFNLSNVIQ